MGDIAEGLINGDFDFFTGEYMGNGGGFPRSRKGNISFRNRGARFYKNGFSDRHKSNGVHWWLHDKGYKDAAQQDAIIRQWAFDKNIVVAREKQITKLCVKIQEDFPAFTKWFNETKNKVA